MIQLNVIYNLNNKLRKDSTAPIYIRAYLDNKRKCFSTGIRVQPSQWSKRLDKVIDHPNANEYNLEISRQVNNLETYIYDWVRKHDSMTLDQLNNYFKYKDSESFTNFWKYELAQDTILQKETKKKHKTALNYFVKFQKEVKFSELTYQFIVDFDRFL